MSNTNTQLSEGDCISSVEGPALDPGSRPRGDAESLLVHFRRVECIKRESLRLKSINLSPGQLCDLELLLNRAYYPLEGYLGREDCENVLREMRLRDGSFWPLPLALDVPEALGRALKPGEMLALRDGEGFMLALLRVEDVWESDMEREAKLLFGTSDRSAHPGVQRFFNTVKPWRVGGPVEGLYLPLHYDYLELRRPPSETHRSFSQRGWRNVLGVLSTDFPHCSHRESYLHAARDAGAGIFLQTLVAQPMPREAEHFSRVQCAEIFTRAFPKNLAMHGLLPWHERLNGPREAALQAIVQKNYGCTHMLVADDHADPFRARGEADSQRYYPRGEAEKLVAEAGRELELEVVPMRRMVYVADRDTYLPQEEIVEGMEVKRISSEELRRRLEFGQDVPAWFSFPEVVEEMRKTFLPRSKQGFTILLTGLSGAGKSTLAKVLYVKFMEMGDRPVTLLDGDIVRSNLSSELNFSREHRELNVRRIGFVASEITKNRGIALCAPIAPYENSRHAVRELISGVGGYVEVFMATPLEVCERRDRKGIYAKARAGVMKGVTGIDDPYEEPVNPELRIDTSEMTPQEGALRVLMYLEELGYIV